MVSAELTTPADLAPLGLPTIIRAGGLATTGQELASAVFATAPRALTVAVVFRLATVADQGTSSVLPAIIDQHAVGAGSGLAATVAHFAVPVLLACDRAPAIVVGERDANAVA